MAGRLGKTGRRGVAFGNDQYWRGFQRFHAAYGVKAALFTCVFGKAFIAVVLDVLGCPVFAVCIKGRNDGGVAVLTGHRALVNTNAFTLQIRRGLGYRLQAPDEHMP